MARKDIPYDFFFFMFAAFIVSCGLTHFWGMVTPFYPYYYIGFWISFVTAIVSIITAIMFFAQSEKIIKIPNPHEIARDNENLQEINNSLEEFSLVAAHDLQDPLKKIKMYLNFVREGDKESIDKIDVCINRSLSFLQDLLIYARSAGKELDMKKDVSLNTVVAQVLDDLQSISTKEDVAVNVGEMPRVNCDPIQIRRVFQNLIKNAIVYSDPGKESRYVNVGCVRKGDDWLFSIEDNGIGIPQSELANLFEVKKNNNRKGRGFGLAISNKIVNTHGGSIRVESKEGEGTTFYFTIVS